MIFCPACGMQNYPGATACARCSTALPVQTAQPAQSQPWQQQAGTAPTMAATWQELQAAHQQQTGQAAPAQPPQAPWQQPQAPQAQPQPQPQAQPWQPPPQPQPQPQPWQQPQAAQSMPGASMSGPPMMASAAPMPSSGGGKSSAGLIIGIIAALLVLAGGGVAAYFLFMKKDDKKAEATAASSEEKVAEDKVEEPIAAGGGSGTGAGTGTGTAVAATGPVAELATVREHACACKDAACTTKAQEEFDAWVTKYNDVDGTADQIAQVEKLATEFSECMMKVMSGDSATASATTTATGGGGSGSGIAECDAYMAAVEEYIACDKIPASARDSTRQGLDSMKSAWAQMSGMPDSAKQQTADACRQGYDAMKQAADALGCPFTATIAASTQPAAVAEVEATGGGALPEGLPNCTAYVEITRKLMACDKMPAAAKDGLKQGLDAMESAWGDLGSIPKEYRGSIDDGCKQGVDALKQAGSAMGCKL